MLTDDQKRVRLMGIGGSEIGAVAGLNDHTSAFDMWLKKTGSPIREKRRPGLEAAARRGHKLEPVIAEFYAEDHDANLVEPGTIFDKQHPWIVATPDRVATFKSGEPRVVEIKTAGPNQMLEWGEPGTDQVPASYLAQAAWEMRVMDLRRTDIAVWFMGEDAPRYYAFERDAEFEEMLIKVGAEFWAHVQSKEPLPMDFGAACRAWLLDKHPRSRGGYVTGAAANRLAGQLKAVNKSIAEIMNRKRTVENQIIELVGDHDGISGPFGIVEYRSKNNDPVINWEAVVGDLIADAVAGPYVQPLVPVLVQKHTQEAPPERVLSRKWARNQ